LAAATLILLPEFPQELGWRRDSLYVTNAVKHFKFEMRGKRRMHKTPAQREIAACRHWLEEELAHVRPKVVVALGATALKALLDTANVNLGEMLGRPVRHCGYWLIASYHPAYVFRAADAHARSNALDVMSDSLRLADELIKESAQAAQHALTTVR